MKSIETMLPDTPHKLCCWHKGQNLTKLFYRCKGNASNVRQTFNKLLSDEWLTETDFEPEWSKVNSCFENDSSNSSRNRMRYLLSLYESRSMLA